MIMSHAQQKTKKRFVLTMRNQKGQVGIFVALIFQVIFVFFAMLVNVGLVVHHKINLQQSTDLAAYYGAMKQAEMMNMMAHVNYQIRQAWKLFAWRYRVLGTFGIEQDAPSVPESAMDIQFPISWKGTKQPKYNSRSQSFSCPATPNNIARGITITDVPFMCMGHNGFADWISGRNDMSETYCKINCGALDSLGGSAFTINAVPSVNTSCIAGNCLGASIDRAIEQTNNILRNTCTKLGPITTQMLALYYGNYIKDTGNRKNFIWMMAKNLGLSEDEMLDIDGNKVITGVKNTLRNNLTEANSTSMKDEAIVAYNGVKAQGGGTSFAERMLNEITFQRLMFYLIDCEYTNVQANGAGDSTIKIKPLYVPGTNDIDANIKNNLQYIMSGAGIQGVSDLFALNSEKVNTIGYEKNPWIQVYYGVKATSEPKIPFLPLAKIKLHAVSFAKPFGGTMGPWYYKKWPSGSPKSGDGDDLNDRTDQNLPVKTIASYPAAPTLKGVREFLPNYSTYVGDVYSNDSASQDPNNKGGLANTKIVAFYHALLANKYGVSNAPPSSSDKTQESEMGRFHQKPSAWPKYSEWYHLNTPLTSAEYDSLAVDRPGPKNTYMRDIELSVVSPNQFDATYYSIDPEFAQNYVDRLQKGDALQKIKAATGTADEIIFPIDFGNTGGTAINGIPRSPYFSVRNQMHVTNELFRKAKNDIVSRYGNGSSEMLFAIDVLATKQSSLLTGWTFLNLTADGYNSFPSSEKTGGKYTMLFGTCDPVLNPWTETYLAPSLVEANLPPTPGNCVSGGRVGYSVKIISSQVLRGTGEPFQNLGGSGVGGPIANPVSESFLQF